MHNPIDVLVVGAGAAGLAAAGALRACGRKVLLVEAADRIGGRAFTDSHTFSVPVDLGCAWLHQADRNPLTPIARRLQLHLLDHEQATQHHRDEGVPVAPDEAAAIAVAKRMKEAGASDRTMGSLLTAAARWEEQVAVCSIAELDTGGDADDTSVQGVLDQGSTTPNWLVEEGMGRIVASLAEGLDIALNQRVTRIEQLPQGVKATTSGGDLVASHCIVTVSTGVLRAEAIRFIPGLGNATLSALDALPMGHFNKVILEFDQPLSGFAPGDWLLEGRTFRPGQALAFLVNPFGSNLVLALAGGSYGRQLSTMPLREATQEVLSRLEHCLGARPGLRMSKSLNTDWSVNTLFHGSYAYLRTGGGDARKTLAAAGTDRIHFAGEATATELMQTCGGAYLTGLHVARKIEAMLPVLRQPKI